MSLDFAEFITALQARLEFEDEVEFSIQDARPESLERLKAGFLEEQASAMLEAAGIEIVGTALARNRLVFRRSGAEPTKQ